MEEYSSNQKSTISAPPELGITIRTLESDIESIERGGGEMVAPQQVSFEKSKIEANINIPGYTGPEKAIFSPTGAISAEQKQLPEKKANKLKTIGVIVGILAIIFTFGFLGYSVVSQWLFK